MSRNRKPPPRVQAHTNKVGAFGLNSSGIRYYTVRSTGFTYSSPGNVTSAISYKSPIVKSDFKSPTGYSRHAIRMDSLTDVDFYDQVYRWVAPSSVSNAYFSMGPRPGGQNFSSPVVSNGESMDNQAVIQARKKLQDLKTEIVEELSQVRATAKTVIGLLEALGAILLALKRRDFRYARKILKRYGRAPVKSAANAWLAYSYAIRPIASTVVGLAQLLSDSRDSGVRKVQSTVSRTGDPSTLYLQSWRLSRIGGSLNISTRCSIYYSIVGQASREFSQLGLTNPFATAWALTPYSFVVDWLIPIQDWLSTLTYSVGVNVHYTVFNRNRNGYAVVRNNEPGEYLVDRRLPFRLPAVRIKFAASQRDVKFVYMPNLYVKTGFNINQLLSASALLVKKA